MPINRGVPPPGHLPDPHTSLVAALVIFHRRIKRGNYHPHNKKPHEVLHGVLHEGWLHEGGAHGLCSNHDDDEVEVEDLRLHEGDSEILRQGRLLPTSAHLSTIGVFLVAIREAH